MNFVVYILKKLAFTVVKDVFCDVNCVKCKKCMVFCFISVKWHIKVNKGANIRYEYNQVPHLTQDTNGKVTNSQLDTTKRILNAYFNTYYIINLRENN